MTMIVSRSSGGAMTPIRELGLRLTVSVCLIYERNTERERERERERESQCLLVTLFFYT